VSQRTTLPILRPFGIRRFLIHSSNKVGEILNDAAASSRRKAAPRQAHVPGIGVAYQRLRAQSSSTMPTTAPTGIGTSPNLFTLRPDPGCRS
jgi:hypothetical protein